MAYSKEQEAAAKARGFPSAAAAIAFQRQKEAQRSQQTIDGGNRTKPQGSESNQSGNFLDAITNMLKRANSAK